MKRKGGNGYFHELILFGKLEFWVFVVVFVVDVVFCYWYFCVLNLLQSTEVPINLRYDSLVYVCLQIHPDYPLKLSK